MAQLYFYYSSMNAGKSTHLLQSSYNYNECGLRTVLFTAQIDDRYAKGKVSSRLGINADAQLFNNDTDLFAEIKLLQSDGKIACVLIDEAHNNFHTREGRYAAFAILLDSYGLAVGSLTASISAILEYSSSITSPESCKRVLNLKFCQSNFRNVLNYLDNNSLRLRNLWCRPRLRNNTYLSHPFGSSTYLKQPLNKHFLLGLSLMRFLKGNYYFFLPIFFLAKMQLHSKQLLMV